MKVRGLGFSSLEVGQLRELREVPSNTVLFGIILYYPHKRFSERAMVEFFRHLASEVPTPFAERRFRDVPSLLGDIHGEYIWSNASRDDPDGWRKNEELIVNRERWFREQGLLPEFELAFRLLSERFTTYAKHVEQPQQVL